MTATIIESDTDLSTFEAPAPPCDYKEHDQHGTGAAVWVVTMRAALVCGCRTARQIYLLCDGCWAYMHSKGGRIYCRACFHTHHLSEDIVSVERL